MASTYFGLLAEYETAEIPLESICTKYFSISFSVAKNRANNQQLPVPAYKAGTNKSPWLVSAADLAKYLDERKEQARREWEQMNRQHVA
ncbi:pyocin activator PrtN family protein [Oceanospirillum beijerinckii]|uniref:pyocin activator PrtN family protein n=1 Tax=Oceanospirillum beijerinckii TaxID=64976 RepID=UPI00040F1CD7|nr:pyocin activator PrtN family protein [Oceanospirillum beijerinckii]